MMRVGLIGWRGMVGSVLMQRMREEEGFRRNRSGVLHHLQPGRQGSGYRQGCARRSRMQRTSTNSRRWTPSSPARAATTPRKSMRDLRAAGWQGYWIDAASTLRMKDDAIIILDPVNKNVIKDGLAKGVKTYVGGNCTVSLMLMATWRPVRQGPDRVDQPDDLPGGLRCRRAQHARADPADGCDQW